MKRFAIEMKRWLWSMGVHRCACGVWSEKVSFKNRRCPECNRKHASVNYHERGVREKQRSWQKEHKDHLRLYNARYYQKRKESASGSAHAAQLPRCAEQPK